jgi:hypothetical protein
MYDKPTYRDLACNCPPKRLDYRLSQRTIWVMNLTFGVNTDPGQKVFRGGVACVVLVLGFCFTVAVSAATIYPRLGPLLRQQAEPAVSIHGYVTGARDVPISSASIEFLNEGEKIVVTTSYRGNYTTEVPPGKYAVTISASGFCSRTEEHLFHRHEDTVSLNFPLMDCSDCDLRDIDFGSPPMENGVPPLSQFPVIDPSKYKYRREKIEGLLTSPAPDILFGQRRETDDLIVYENLSCLARDPKPAILRYGAITLSAATLTYPKKSHTILADGDVLLLDESGIKHASHAELTVAGSKLRVSYLK